MRRAVFACLAFVVFIAASPPAAAATSAQSVLAQEASTGIGAVTSLLSGIDATLTDTAVTAADLADAGMIDNSLPALIDPPDMLIVDDDKFQCPNAQFTTISAAVLAAAPGATIKVCPGIYRESVTITKPLTLEAPRQQGQATECMTPTADDPTQEAILQYSSALNGGNPSEGFDVMQSGVTIEGFKVEPNPLLTHDGVGIFTSPLFAGYTIEHNVLQNNTIGIYVNSDGSAPTTVQTNCLRLNNLGIGPPQISAAPGNGVYSDQGLSNAQITNNFFTGDQNGAIIIDTFKTAPHDISITHNSSVNDGPIGTFATGGPTAFNLTVDHNKITGSNGSGIVTTNVTTSEYAYNDVENAMFNGISLHSTSNSTVSHNRASGNQLNGIRLNDSSDSNTVSNNRSENNLQAGLSAAGQSGDNSLTQNHMDGNVPDCDDNTTGAGTGGTANFWIKDFGLTEDRPGICKHAGP